MLMTICLILLLVACPMGAEPVYGETDKTAGRKQNLYDRNRARWENLTEAQKDRYRELFKKYKSLSAEQQKLLKRKLKIFNELPEDLQRFILTHFQTLKTLSITDRKSFFRLINKYRRQSPLRKADIQNTFKKINTLEPERAVSAA